MIDSQAKRLTELQAKKLSRVMTTTQRLLSGHAIDDIRVEEIAKASHVSPSTLYNRFGTKDGLISAALLAYFDDAVVALIARREDGTPLQSLLHGLDATIHKILEAPQFANALMVTYFRPGPRSTANTQLTQRVTDTYLPILVEMRAKRCLADWTDLPVLATEISDRQFGVIAKWSQERIPDTELQDRFRLAVLTLLHGVSRGRQAEEVEVELKRLHARFAA